MENVPIISHSLSPFSYYSGTGKGSDGGGVGKNHGNSIGASKSQVQLQAQVRRNHQCCQIAKFDPFLSLDCARVEGVGGTIQGKEGIKFCSVA